MGDGWQPRTGEAWFRWVEGELRSLRRHRHGGAVGGMAFGSSAMVQFDPEGNRIWMPGGETGVFATATADVTPPPPPSTPVAVERLGTVTLTWDGLAAESALMPADLFRVEVHRSQESDFYPSDGTLVGYMQPGGASLVMPDQAYGSLWYYRLVAVDKSGNRSDASRVASATTNKTVTGDLAQNIIDDILTGVNGAALATTSIQSYQNEYAVSASDTIPPTTGWSTNTPTRTPGTYIWFRTTVTYGDNTTSTTNPALLTGNDGASVPAPAITLTCTTQILVSPPAGGATTPATAVVSGAADNTTITAWTYSVDGGAFSATVPDGVSRTNNVVTITGATMTASTIAVRMADVNGVSDTLTVAKVSDGADGTPGTPGAPGDDATTVMLTNEAHTFPGDNDNALAGSTTTTVIAYVGTTLTAATIGTITGQVTGLTTAITNNGTTTATVTVTVTTALVTQSGTLTIPVTVAGTAFTKDFSWAVSFTGGQGIPGTPGADGTTYYTWLKYADTPTTGMSDDPTGKTYMGLAMNKTSATESTNYADYSWSLIKGTDGVPGSPGADGTTTYTWVKYGDSPTTGMSDDPTGKTYIGLAFNKTTATESVNYADYSWSLIKGADGATGVGITSVTPYFQQTAANASAPAKPTASPPPSPWTTTEPDYVADTALWRTERIIYTNATFAYTDVTKVSSYTAAVSAQTTADGKNTVYYSNSAPTTQANKAGDTWFVFSGTQITGVWKGNGGTSWTQQTITSSAITNLDAGVITAGYLGADRLAAKSIAVSKLAVGDLSNFIEINESFAPSVVNTSGGSTHQIETISGVRWSKRSVNTTTEFYLRDTKGPIPFVAGDRIRVTMRAFSDTATSAQMYLHTYDAAGTYLTSQQIGTALTIGTTETLLAWEGDIGTTVMANAVQYLLGLYGLTSGVNVRIRAARAYEMNAGQLVVDGSIIGDKIAANAITSDKIDAGAITTEKLDALLVLAGVMASGTTGRRWEADQYGIRLYDTDDTLLINLPTDPNTPATFKGDVVARSFTSLDQFTMRGTINEISRDSSLKLAAGYTAPGSPPSVLVYTNNAAITNPNPSAYIYDPRLHGLVRDGSYYYSAQWDNFNGYIYRYSASTLALDAGWSIEIGSQVVDGGVTVLGSYIYALHRTPNSSLWDLSKYLLSTGAWQATYPVTEYLTNFADGYWQALGNDGTDLLVGYRTTGSSVNITKFSTSGVAGTLITTNITGWLWNVTSVNYGNFDYGAARYVVTAENRENQTNNPLSAVLAYSGTGNVWNLQQNEQWPLPGQTHGMCWDSTLSQFISLDFSSLTLNFWSGVKWTTESSSWWASTTWYDSNSTGGTHETTQGPRTNFTMRKRASVRTTSSPIPPRPTPNTTDDVMRPRFYLGRGATDPGQSAMWLQTEVADGVNYLEQTGTVAFSGTNPPTTNNFPGANAAQITSSDASSIVIKGDGTGNFGSLVVASGKTNLGTHVLKSTSISTTTVSAATWTNLLFSGTTTINQDSWTLASSYYWTCPTPGTYAIQLRVNLTAAANFKLEMNAESTGDGTVQVMGGAFGGGHDYGQVTIPAIRMSANDRIYTQIYNASAITVNGGVLVVTRLG